MAQLLALHRDLVAIESLSHAEGEIAEFIACYLRDRGAQVERLGDNVIARAGVGPRLLLNSHFDTVPATDAWTRDPWAPTVEAGRVYGLGSNDAKASVAAMMLAFLRVVERGGPCEVVLLLVPEEETGGEGAERAWPHVRGSGFEPQGVVVGEPTGLDIAIAQKGLLILELEARGDGGHSANARASGARNALRELARDLLRLEDLTVGPAHELLGETTIEPTMARGGDAKNRVPERATCVLDLRTVPGATHADIVGELRGQLSSEVHVLSDRLAARACPSDADIIGAALLARPQAKTFGSRTMSDLVYFDGVPAIKCGPGLSTRSHQADEFVLESELSEGVEFYTGLIERFARCSAAQG